MPWPTTAEATEELLKLGDTPFTEHVIPRVGPPRCLCCGEFVGKCDHGDRWGDGGPKG